VTVYFSGWKYIVFFYIIKLIIVIVNTLPSALSDIVKAVFCFTFNASTNRLGFAAELTLWQRHLSFELVAWLRML
jgi:hypothetical protein